MILRVTFLFGVAATILAACNTITSQSLAPSSSVQESGQCERGTIDYRLPEWKLEIRLIHEKAIQPQRYRVEVAERPIQGADPSQIYCVSIRPNAASQDQIGVLTSDNGLLKRVYTKTIDRSVDVAVAAAQTVAGNQISNAVDPFRGGIGGQPVSSDEKQDTYGPYKIDPFDVDRMEELNSLLREVGLCMTLDGRNDRFVPYDNLCIGSGSSGEGAARSVFTKGFRSERELQPEQPLPPKPWGVLYRPLLTHNLQVFRQGAQGVQLEQNKIVSMPNKAPALAISVRRAAFAKRETDLQFDGGVLYQVDLDKDSEVAGFVTIPIKVAQVIVGIPAQIVRVRIQSASQQTDLIKANNELITALAALKQAEADLDEAETQRGNKEPSDFNSLSALQRNARIDAFCRQGTTNADVLDACTAEKARCVAETDSFILCGLAGEGE